MSEEKTFVCACCGEEHPITERTVVENQPLCRDCAAKRTVICDNCGKLILRRHAVCDENRSLCHDCYRQYYSHCEDCGRLLPNYAAYYLTEDGEEYAYCEYCYEERMHNSIRDYYYKPSPIFYEVNELPRKKENTVRYFGVELEIDGAGENRNYAERIMAIANGKFEHIYCKHDGSLEDGFEIVTHPMTLRYHLQEMPWVEVLTEAGKLHYYSHQTTTCGLHIHVNRKSLGATEREQEETIARILYFFEKHWEELIKFSRRSQRQLERWAARYGYKDRPGEILKYAKEDRGCDRYFCVNLQNDETIEFRMFRGSLKYNAVIATLQLVDRICEAARLMSDEEIKEMPWTSFVLGCHEPELVRYLKERRLYVNEPIAMEEEEI